LAISKKQQLLIIGAAVALLGGCASAPEQKPGDSAPAATSDDAAKAAAAKAAADKAAADQAAADKAAADAKARSVAAAPAAPAAPKTATIKGSGLFDFNKSVLRPDAKSALDSAVVAKKGDVKSVSSVTINGHADRLGSHEYNQKLSEKRAEVVKAYLVGKGVPANNVETNGFGKTQPAQGVAKCEDTLARPKLIECLQPHRRVEVELKGEAK